MLLQILNREKRTALEKTLSATKAATILTNAKKEATAVGAAQSVSTFLANTRASAQARFFTFVLNGFFVVNFSDQKIK